MLIQWYPGHMAKARRMLVENLKLIDVVIELVDARAPMATRNPDFDDLFAGKDRIVIMNKSDLAEPAACKEWIAYYKEQGAQAIEFVSTNAAKRKQAISMIEAAAAEKVRKMKEKGVLKTVRAMVVGIPNVGKSTFINRMAGSQRAQVGDKPGVTRGKQWVKISPYLELMDTPGLLWPKLENERLAKHLAYIGSVKDDIMDVERLAANLLSELNILCPEALAARYKKVQPGMEPHELLMAVCRSRGFLLSGGEGDTERAARIVLDEYRAGKIDRVTLERPGDNFDPIEEETSDAQGE
ncbi:MAG: ribosome biogenesis GTPase YlqF [Clostridia bacterium]|nr:ribosome biogenesis GTPase YlqF [Clostridia bacterium]MBR0026480.1 ribosome biogenesis GTPase YlqF [Clostridia bacterium]